MTRMIMIGVLGIAVTFAGASALDVGVGVFVSPGFVAGEASYVTRLSAGLAGRVSLGVTERLNVACGVGYNDFVYGEEDTPHIWNRVSTIPMIIITPGVDYTFLTGAVRTFAGGGAAIARETAEAYQSDITATDWYGGVYVQGGVRYTPVGRLGVEAAPRYTFLFDERAVEYEGGGDFVRSEHRSQLVEFLVGFNYYF